MLVQWLLVMTVSISSGGHTTHDEYVLDARPTAGECVQLLRGVHTQAQRVGKVAVVTTYACERTRITKR